MFKTLLLSHDPALALHRIELFPPAALAAGVLPCLSSQVIEEMEEAMDRVAALADDEPGLSHLIMSSQAPVFILGADLAAVVAHLKAGNRSELSAYLRQACRFAHRLHGHLHPRVHTVALVQGTAMGGGFEVALACETLIAEAGVKFGLPETAFGSFAGCGAPSFLARLVGPTLALRMLGGGQTWSAEDLQTMGVLAHCEASGQGEAKALALVAQQRRAGTPAIALKRVREALAPVSLLELERIAEVWVDTAFLLSDRQIATMEKIVQAQGQRVQAKA